LFTTIGMAACIGLVLGLVSLYMTKQERPEAYNETTFAEKEEPTSSKDQTDASNQSLEGFSFFVIQGGVFSNMDNANSQAEKFTEYGHAPFNWQTEDGVYVFVDVASNEEEAKHLAKKIEQNSFDVFVTKREIDSVQLSMSDREYEWLTQFLALWQD